MPYGLWLRVATHINLMEVVSPAITPGLQQLQLQTLKWKSSWGVMVDSEEGLKYMQARVPSVRLHNAAVPRCRTAFHMQTAANFSQC